ncbi:NLR family CARD domain-containing protein 3-like [Dysidea avara]|uniref:NLR family CARD domain-containing protein 3-like n=1 Tax=Dysidea avara TaxID=196820 RepID=UPI0033323FBE
MSNIPDTTKSQKIKELSQIFSSLSDNTILIEGQPGIGKTTLVKEICIEWAEGKLLTSDKLVLLLLLRDPNVQKITNTQQLIEHFTKPTGKVTQLHNYLEDNHGENVTFIINGFDELSSKLRKQSFLTQLIQREFFTKSRIVVTSRPYASACLHHIVDRRIEVLGFDQTSKMKYACDCLQDNPCQLVTLQKHFQQYPNIDAMCYIPLVMSIIVFLCMCHSEDLPPTASKMYQSFVLHTICRYLIRSGKIAEGEHINEMKHLPQTVQQTLKLLEKVAFDGLINDKIVFTESDLPDICRDDPLCYGLLQSVQCYSVNEMGTPLRSFNFLHLGIQEYFAAKHVAILPEYEVYKLLKDSFLVDDNKGIRLSNMWIMYCGIKHGHCNTVINVLTQSESHSESLDQLQTSPTSHPPMRSTIISQPNPLQSSSNTFLNVSATSTIQPDLYPQEQSSNTMCSQLVTKSTNGNAFNQPQKMLVEYQHNSTSSKCCTSNGELISSTTVALRGMISSNQEARPRLLTIPQNILKNPVKVLYLFQCFQEAEDVTFSHMLSKSFDSGVIDINRYTLLPHQVTSLGFFLSRSDSNWKELNLSFCNIRDCGISVLNRYICRDTTCNHRIANINLQSNSLTNASSHVIIDIISCLKPHALLLGNNCFDSLMSILIAATDTVKILDLRLSSIKANEVSLISDMMISLEELYIGWNDLHDQGVIRLSEGIAKIKVCVINQNQVTDSRVAADNASLKPSEGQSGNANISTCDAANIYYLNDKIFIPLEFITVSTTLRVLDISHNKITATGITAIAMVLSYNTSLEVLTISSCSIDHNGAKAMANAITNNIILKELHIGANIFGDRGAVVLLEAVVKNSTLKVLDISSNHIRDLGAEAIAECLLGNKSLEVLIMGRNALGQDGATSIATAITNNKTLKKLSLIGALDYTCFDNVDEKSLMTLLSSLYHNTSINELELPNNDDNVKKEIEDINNSRTKRNMKILSVHYEIDRDRLNKLFQQTRTPDNYFDDLLDSFDNFFLDGDDV